MRVPRIVGARLARLIHCVAEAEVVDHQRVFGQRVERGELGDGLVRVVVLLGEHALDSGDVEGALKLCRRAFLGAQAIEGREELLEPDAALLADHADLVDARGQLRVRRHRQTVESER